MMGARRLRPAVWICLVAAMLACLAAAAALISGAVWPEASGDKRLCDGDLTVDASHLDCGYIMARGPQTQRRLKLRVSKDDVTMTYDLNGEGDFEVFPLQMGSGEYRCTLYRCVEGNRYSQEGAVSLKAQLSVENIAFLSPNQYVSYTPDSPAVLQSAQVCEGLTTQREKYDAICAYVQRNFTYDFVRAVNAPESAKLADVDGCFERRRGICQDLAAITVCMLRVQGIPARLVIGYVGDNYHAWTTAEVDGETCFFDPTAAFKPLSKSAEYVAERYY